MMSPLPDRSNLNSVLDQFDPISINEMENVALMDRMETKFIVRRCDLEGYLNRIQQDYRIFEIAGKRTNRYENLYFDTPESQMYQEHHRGKLNRYKVRYRSYVDVNLQYFEIKFKNKKGRVVKNRIKRKGITPSIDPTSGQLLSRHTHYSACDLVPKLWSNYSRITLVSKNSKERLTIDMDLEFKNEHAEKILTGIVIVEVKQESATPSSFISLMRQERVQKGSISKYCYGVVYLNNQVKKNNFKRYLLKIEKLSSYEFT